MSRKKAIEIVNNLQQSIEKATNQIINSSNKMFTKPTISKNKLQRIMDKLITKYSLTKKDLL